MQRVTKWPVCLALCVLIGVSGATAQEVTVKPRPVETVTIPYADVSPVWVIRQHLTSGDRDRLRAYALEFVGTLAKHPQLKDRLDPAKSFRLILLTRDGAGKTVATSVLISQPAVEWGRLPGVGGDRNLFEIYLSDSPRSTVTSVWTSKAEENPLATAAGDFVQAILPKLALPTATLLTLESTRGSTTPTCAAPPATAADSRWRTTQPELPERPPLRPAFCLEAGARGGPVLPSFTAAITEVPLSQRRSSLTVGDAVTVQDTSTHMSAENTALQWVLRQRYSGNSSMLTLIDAIAVAVVKAVGSAECQPPVINATACATGARTAIRAAYSAATVQPADRDHALKIARTFEELAGDAPTYVTGQSTVSNMPATRFTFAVGTAVIGKAWLPTDEPRIKNQSGNIVADPLGRLTAYAGVNWFPRGFQPRTGGVAEHESFRFFGGAAFAPYFGPLGAVGWGFTRTLAVNVGGGLILTDTMPANRVGTPVKAGESFSLGWVPMVFVGMSVKVGK